MPSIVAKRNTSLEEITGFALIAMGCQEAAALKKRSRSLLNFRS